MIDPWARTDFLFQEPKIVAFDFDETISDNEIAWLNVMQLLERQAYHCIIVTWRRPTQYPEDLKMFIDKGFKVYYTSQQAKQTYMQSMGVKVDIWVDDNPFAILNDAI